MSRLGDNASALESLIAGLDPFQPGLVPPEIAQRARTCVIDMLAGAFALPHDLRPNAARAVVSRGLGASVFGATIETGPADAAFANAVASATAETNDTHAPTATHPGIVVIPAVLAVAEAEGLSGASILAGIVAGYEAMGRLARIVVTPELVRTFRSSGVVGPTAAAIGVARALGLSEAQTVHAAALATHAAGGLNEWSHAGAGEHVFQIGHAARTGTVAALLARIGVEGAASILDGRAGLFAAFGGAERAGLVVRGPNEPAEICNVVHKPAPACFFVQTPAQVAARLAHDHQPDPAAISSVAIHVAAAAAGFPGCDNPGPMRTRQDASMSLQFSVSSVLVEGRIAHSAWEAWDHPTVNALAGRTRLVVDDGFTHAWPARLGARVVLREFGGRTLQASAPDFASMRGDEVAERFLATASPVVGPSRAEAALELAERLDTLNEVRGLARLLRPLREEQPNGAA